MRRRSSTGIRFPPSEEEALGAVNGSCVRLSLAQVRQAQQAGWPGERAFVQDVLGVRLPGAREENAVATGDNPFDQGGDGSLPDRDP